MIKHICICGAGTMGAGIAQVSAQAGFDTIVYDVNKTALGKAQHQIDKSLLTLESKGKLKEGDREEIASRVRFTADLHDCIADLFIEAIAEKLEIKISLFNELAKRNPESIFASNTSSLSITNIAKALPIPGNVAGLHFFNPAPLMKLVEIVTTTYTTDNTTKAILEVAGKMEKIAVICKDSPGFIVNRVARPYYIESLRMVEENLASCSEIDELLEATGFRMGPFRLMDLIGNDINYAVSTSVYEQLGYPPRLQPSFIQEKKVLDGDLGKKTGRGYYDYH
ncbi:MAG: 3-hydroxybutyryl-CoA dehydrogenase [Chitinophagaceae bacterium]|nr:MAG: 3-hydroxybutyryl-CoA dehydrogenase [Chitinophagaceae bacterium]